MNRWSLALLGCAVAAPLIAAQLKVDVQLVHVVATVTDENGRYVSDLTPDDLVVLEDGQVQKISYLSQSEDLPVSMGLVLDSSGSMAQKIETAAEAVERFIRTIHEDDDIFLLTFSDRPFLVQDFTHDRNRLASALQRVRVGGETALYDALDESLRKIRSGKNQKRAILLITDGQDTASSTSFDQALRSVRESELLVYALGISASNPGTLSGPGPTVPPIIGTDPSGRRTPPVALPIPRIPGLPGIPGGIPIPGIPTRRLAAAAEPQRQRLPGGVTVTGSDSVDMNVLDSLAESSGGKAWLLTDSWANNRGREINGALDEIAAELRNQYTIGYYPAHPIKDNKWHRIEVTAKNKYYRVRARKEYFGG